MVLEAVLQALKRAEQLKKQLQNVGDLLVDGTLWDKQQKILELYQQVLLLDMEYSLDQKVEQDLWNFGHKNFITALQSLAKDKENPQRSEAQNMLNWFLDAASGFYLTLIGEVCSQFHLDLPFRRKDSIFGLSWPEKKYPISEPQKSSCLYFCQHCLVHLGDIARYRSHAKQSETYYKHAVQLSPSSGQPYNQLALLAANKGDQLSTVFNYVRSMAVRHPFTAAGINLDKTLKRCATSTIAVEGKMCLTGPELVAMFLKLHGLLKCQGKVDEARPLVGILGQTLTALVATQNFSSWKLIQMLVINIFVLQESNGQQEEVLLDLMATLFSACLLPVYTLAQADSLQSYAAVPFIKMTMEWIVLNPSILSRPGFFSKRQIWPSLCHLLNLLAAAPEVVEKELLENHSDLPLPEDNDIQGFLLLQPYLSKLKFSYNMKNEPKMGLIRVARVLKLGESLTRVESKLISMDCSGAFVPVGQSQLEASEIIKKLEELSFTKENHAAGSHPLNHGSSAASPVPSDAGSCWETGKSTPDSSGGSGSVHGVGDFQNSKLDEDLWPPRSKEVDEDINLPGRMNQNVAIRAILRGKQQNQNPPPLPPTTNGNGHFNGWKSPIDVSFQSSQPPSNSLFGGVSDGNTDTPPQQSNGQQFNLWGPNKTAGDSIWGGANPVSRPTSSPYGSPFDNGEVNQCDKGYSLFSSTPAWCITGDKNQTTGKQVDWKAPEPKNVQPPLQSLWSGSSALERLLEQQKQQREGGT